VSLFRRVSTNADIAADFVTSNVEQDLNRLLDESASATALRELCLTHERVANVKLSST